MFLEVSKTKTKIPSNLEKYESKGEKYVQKSWHKNICLVPRDWELKWSIQRQEAERDSPLFLFYMIKTIIELYNSRCHKDGAMNWNTR